MKAAPYSNRLQVPLPCAEDFNRMQAVDGGSHCNTCSHLVVDFTDWDETDIIRYLQSRGDEKTCGHFHNDQLVRKKSTSRLGALARMVALTVMGLFISRNEALAQQAETTESEEPTSAAVNDSVVWVIRGEVKCDTQSVPGARVVAIGANGDTLASSEVVDGRFEMHVPVAYRTQSFTIAASAPGYKVFRIEDYIPAAGHVLGIQLEKSSVPQSRKKVKYATLGCPSF